MASNWSLIKKHWKRLQTRHWRERQEREDYVRGLEAMKWVVVVALLLVAIVGNYLYRDIMLPLRALAVVILIAAAGGVALLTTKGKATVAFAREARTEVRKVIWPTRQETLHTTLIVAAVTAVMSLILWGLDGILVRLVSFITGLRF